MGIRSKIINLTMFTDFSFSLIKDNYVIQFLIAAWNSLMNHKTVTGSFKWRTEENRGVGKGGVEQNGTE